MSTAVVEYHESGWSLDDLFPDWNGPEMRAVLDDLENRLRRFGEIRPELSPELSGARFAEIIDQIEAITDRQVRVMDYAELLFAENSSSQEAQSAIGRAREISADTTNRTLFFTIWWKDLDDDVAQRLLAESGDRRAWLEILRQFAPYTLSEREERIINVKNVTGSHAMQALYDAITNRYSFTMLIEGEERAMTRAEMMVLFSHPDPDVRARAYQEVYRVFGENGPVLAQLFGSIARDWDNEQVDLRGFPSPMAARNLENSLPNDVVETVLDVCRRNAGVFQRFFRLKAGALGMERLRRYDTIAPVGQTDRSFTYDEAVHLVLDTFGGFDARLPELVSELLQEEHLDSEDRPGKNPLAFCLTVTPRLLPWVSSTFHGRPRDVAVLAHELGHAIHSMLSSDHSILVLQPSLAVAETASLFSEMLLVDRLLAEESDPETRRAILFDQLSNMYGSIGRQAFFALFERQAHDLVRQGASADEMCEAYMETLREQFGDAVDVPEEFRWEWVAIFHFFHVPFYVYAYAFAHLLVLGLYEQYRRQGAEFTGGYMHLLAAGGSIAPERLLADSGIDIHDAGFWEGAFAVINRMVDELEMIQG